LSSRLGIGQSAPWAAITHCARTPLAIRTCGRRRGRRRAARYMVVALTTMSVRRPRMRPRATSDGVTRLQHRRDQARQLGTAHVEGGEVWARSRHAICCLTVGHTRGLIRRWHTFAINWSIADRGCLRMWLAISVATCTALLLGFETAKKNSDAMGEFALRAAFTLAAGSAFIGLRFRARRNQTSAEMSRAASIASVQPSGFAAMI
jgi:hypothetical protein